MLPQFQKDYWKDIDTLKEPSTVEGRFGMIWLRLCKTMTTIGLVNCSKRQKLIIHQ